MQIKEFIGSTVLDKNANVVGKVDNVDFNTETGKIETIVLTLQKNIFSRDELEINFDDIATIGAYVILNKEIETEVEEEAEEAEPETVEIEIEEEE
jgi:sporulation protein YlmC with PRC-barrel domain